MGLIFFGFFFVFLNFEIPLGAGVLNVMPAFLGYLLVLLGCGRIDDGAPRFLRIRAFSVLLAVISLGITVLNAIPVSLGNVVPLLLNLLSVGGALYVAYEIVAHVKEKERERGRSLGGSDLTSAWCLLALGNLLSIFAGYMESMALLCLALQLLSIAWYQAALYRAWQKIEPRKK